MAEGKENIYAGKVRLFIGGRPAEELGDAYVSAVVADWFIRSMFRAAQTHPELAGLERWEYTGIDCERFRRQREK